MESISAVVTTGIYCLPGCPARPRPDNVRHFLLPASAEAAGYRACLRCRPYRAPFPPSRIGPDIVCRAVQLILDGVLDDATEGELGARLGVSARHLRRLFLDHLGVSPDGLARSARAHFARRLLDETDLPISEVAFAAGFGSVRQFNRVCVEVFRLAPRLLRHRRRASDRLVADGGLALRLPYHGPLDWPATLAYLSRRAIPGVEHVSGDIYRRTILIGGDPGVLELRHGTGRQLELRLHLPHWEGLVHIVARARRIATLDLDAVSAVRDLSTDPLLGPLVVQRPGIRPPGTWDPFEAAVQAITGQPRSGAVADSRLAQLVDSLGGRVPGLTQLGLNRTFPTATDLATADLSDFGLSPVQTKAVRGLAERVSFDALPLDGSLTLERLVAALTAIDGVSSRTAHFVALRLGEPDACPLPEAQARRLLARKAVTSTRRHGPLTDTWRPWRAVATAQLWASHKPG